MTSGKLCLILAVLLGCALGELNIKNGVYNITEDNFEEFMTLATQKKATFYIKFYSPMCDHCKKLKPIYIEAAKVLADDPDGLYYFADVNTFNYERLSKHFDISSLPTLMIFSPLNDYNPIVYKGERTVFSMVTEIELASGLISKELANYAEFEQRHARRNENMILGVFKSDNSPLFKKMQEMKNDFKYVRIYYTYNLEEYRSKLNLGAGDEFILKFHNKEYIESNDKLFKAYDASEYATLKDFITNEYPYDIEILTDKVEAIYNLRPRPSAILFTSFLNRTEEVKKLALQMKPLGRQFKKEFNIFIQNTGSTLARKHMFEGNATYIIFDDKEESKYRYWDKVFYDTIDVDALIKFTQDVLDKKAPKYIRTAEINKDDLGMSVIPVVASNFDEAVKDPTKHVFLRYFDKMVQRFEEQITMRKEWVKVGKYFANITRKDVVIAEIETNDNDVHEFCLEEMKKGHHFFLYKKNSKDKPLIYTGPIRADEMIKFAEANLDLKEKHKEDL